MATNSSCASLGPNSIEHDHPNANTEFVGCKGNNGEKDKMTIEESKVEFLRICRDADGNTVHLDDIKKNPTEPPDVSLPRVLRCRKQKKSESFEQNNAVGGADSDIVENCTNHNTIKRKEKQMKQVSVDEFSRTRVKLRYFLHRITYEQNLIDAYSTEGWKGKSLEKIKPVKELQRAKSGIFKYKLKIRDLFQHIDMLLAPGRLPESSFDPEGQIDSEDIFCAKCGSKDLQADNDIILCDGACVRGFHQMCLEPPLLKADIPPGDEPWLCPGCVCKLDCFVLLNNLQGTNLSLRDSWEKVFPGEAASATTGNKLDDISGLPSDDSEDDDYNPATNPEVDQNSSQEDKSTSSVESDYFSASDDFEAPPVLNNLEVTGLPSEDSEDEDYDPGAPGHDTDQEMQESSSSDFSSDCEDVGGSPGQHQLGNLEIGAGAGECSPKDDAPHLQSNDELVYEDIHPKDDNKLHDLKGMCRSISSNSGDKGCDSISPKRKSRSPKAAQKSSDQTESSEMSTNFSQIKNQNAKERRRGKRPKVEGLVTSEQGSSSKRIGKSKYGEDAIKRLFECFKENQYPNRVLKEKLVAELGLTIQQVNKWFENARWSFHHSSTNQATNQT
ncbi:unnamed protein product [Cuscuta epithymum]|uniref:Uncharacterized protein n=1 Tax=Cuscuta epithymum TaxID=186058 RepID=A0AAV0ERH0_9ASTE|nr:unnamed protein product [Cuscuta epithymum]